MRSVHESVLLKKSIDFLNVESGVYVDCTLGGGGQTMEMVKRLKSASGRVVCLDVDIEAIKRFEKRLFEEKWTRSGNTFSKENIEIIVINENFEKLEEVLNQLSITKVNGIIADLGLSSDQIEDEKRGFSYMKDGPLDMRMDKRLGATAADLVNGLYESELTRLFKESDERYSKSIARNIVKVRKEGRIDTTLHLVQIIKKALPKRQQAMPSRHKKDNESPQGAYWIKPAMRVFQALRVGVNIELTSLRQMLPQALETLEAGGRLVVISFHSGEDRIVKHFCKESQEEGIGRVLTKKVILPSSDEQERNLRSRSAKLRVIEKL